LRSAPADLKAGATSAFERAGLKPSAPSASNSNDDSLVLRISANGMNFLLPGDAGKIAEKGLLSSAEPLESQVLKLAHHGTKSSTSADFLARVAPRVAIVSSEGPDNGLGHFPSPEILEALQNAGARVFRTDLDGAITVQWKDGSLVVRTYRGTETVVMTGAGGTPLSEQRSGPERDKKTKRQKDIP
jgi:competence protein ComEC